MTTGPDPIIRDLEIMAGSVNYQKWIYDNISMYLGKRVIELGAGIGNFTRLLADREIVVAVDNSEQAVAKLQGRFSQFQNVVPLQIDIEGPELTALKRFDADTLVCINVLEHMKDDAKVLSDMVLLLQPGGTLILLVPAFPFLYGTIDRVVGHYRRYSRKGLAARLKQAGFLVRELYFMNSVSVFGWFLNNRVLKRKEESPSQVAFFDAFVVPLMKTIERAARPPFGLSLIAISERI